VEDVGAVVGEGLGSAGVEHGHEVSLFVTGPSEQSANCDRTIRRSRSVEFGPGVTFPR